MQAELAAFQEVSDEAVIDADIGALIRVLWADPGVQASFAERHKFQLNDSAP